MVNNNNNSCDNETNNDSTTDCDNKSAPSAFISAPSYTTVEYEQDDDELLQTPSSSREDAARKRLYRQQLQAAAIDRQQQQQQQVLNNNNNNNNTTGMDDDTSLSSTNLSPSPLRVQLTSSNSDIQFKTMTTSSRSESVRRLQSETTYSSGGVVVSGNRENEELLEVALLPPSVPDAGVNTTNDGIENVNHDRIDEQPQQQQQEQQVMALPKMPRLNSRDSLRENTSSGGDDELSSASNNISSSNNSSINNNNNKAVPTPSFLPNKKATRSNTHHNRKQQQQNSPPSNEKRQRKKQSHKRQRSGDLVAATLMNPNRTDWIGMNRDNLPLPSPPSYYHYNHHHRNSNNNSSSNGGEDDGSSSLVMPSSTPTEGSDNGITPNSNDGGNRVYSSYMSPISGVESTNNNDGGDEEGGIFSPNSSEMYDFSDSTGENQSGVGGGGGYTDGLNQQQQQQQQHRRQYSGQQNDFVFDSRQQEQQQQHHRRQYSGQQNDFVVDARQQEQQQQHRRQYSGQQNDFVFDSRQQEQQQQHHRRQYSGQQNDFVVDARQQEQQQQHRRQYSGQQNDFVFDSREQEQQQQHRRQYSGQQHDFVGQQQMYQQQQYQQEQFQQQMYQQQQYQQQQQYFDGQYNNMPMYDNYGYSPRNMQWYHPPHYRSNSFIPDIYQDRNESERGESESSYTGSGETGGSTTTSSSYVSEEEEEDASKSTQSSSSSPRHLPRSFSISGHNNNNRNNIENPSSFDRSNPPEILVKHERSDSKIDQIIQKVSNVLDVPLYRTKDETELPAEKTKYPTFFCPNCKTKQRAFLSVATASEQQSSPLGYLALYFGVYMVSSLFIFGLEEGWQPLDCVYFSVITLTTAGLGDFVPTTDSAKIVCACFIYVGVATIGLLLGSLLAGSLDDATKKDAYDAQVKDCPNCQRMERMKARAVAAATSPMGFHQAYFTDANDGYDEVGEAEQESANGGDGSSFSDVGFNLPSETPARRKRASHTRHMSLLAGSPKLQKKKALDAVLPLNSALKRKSHTRHMSLGGSITAPPLASSVSDGLDKIDESTPLIELKKSEHSTNEKTTRSSEVKFSEESSYSTSSSDTSIFHSHPSKPLTRLKAAKYIFLTLNKALAKSLFVIAAGSIGFYYIEEMSVVDSFYFTTVLLTSVGYGDIVPVTEAGKMFTTVFIIVAGTILLHNMTLISMIPLELRKRRIEHAVLGQFGDQLTDDELRELSTGTLVNRLKLATNRPDGLDECTREMFSLAMLVRLGRVTEEDVKATFAAFRRLDVGNYGRLNSRTIIEGELMKRRAMSSKNLVAMAKEDEWDDGESPTNYSHSSYPHEGGPQYAPQQMPVPHFQFFDYSQQGQMPMYAPSYPPLYGGTPRSQFSPSSPHTQYSEASRFNFDEYEQWASNWDHYDTLHQTRSH